MKAAPYCLHCDERVDPDRGVLVLVDGAARLDRQSGEASWVCHRQTCLERLAKAAEEEDCDLLRPQGIFDSPARPDGLPAWVVWISRDKAEAEATADGLFATIYRPFHPTAR
jgi:hypothetical protein